MKSAEEWVSSVTKHPDDWDPTNAEVICFAMDIQADAIRSCLKAIEGYNSGHGCEAVLRAMLRVLTGEDHEIDVRQTS